MCFNKNAFSFSFTNWLQLIFNGMLCPLASCWLLSISNSFINKISLNEIILECCAKRTSKLYFLIVTSRASLKIY